MIDDEVLLYIRKEKGSETNTEILFLRLRSLYALKHPIKKYK